MVLGGTRVLKSRKQIKKNSESNASSTINKVRNEKDLQSAHSLMQNPADLLILTKYKILNKRFIASENEKHR